MSWPGIINLSMSSSIISGSSSIGLKSSLAPAYAGHPASLSNKLFRTFLGQRPSRQKNRPNFWQFFVVFLSHLGLEVVRTWFDLTWHLITTWPDNMTWHQLARHEKIIHQFLKNVGFLNHPLFQLYKFSLFYSCPWCPGDWWFTLPTFVQNHRSPPGGRQDVLQEFPPQS